MRLPYPLLTVHHLTADVSVHRNFGITILIAFANSTEGGGWHMVVGADGDAGVAVLDAPYGIVVMGPYDRVMYVYNQTISPTPHML